MQMFLFETDFKYQALSDADQLNSGFYLDLKKLKIIYVL